VRIVAGEFRGRTIDGPAWDGLRPTSDSLRETLFNILGPTVLGVRVLDAFAGTGAVGIEALSRGAARVTFVERDPRAIKLIESNLAKLLGPAGARDRWGIIRGDFMTGRPGEFDLVFLDPPYELADLDAAIRRAAAQTAPGGRLIVEHRKKREVPEVAEGLAKYRTLVAGDSALSFYTAVESA
jgi:16S rRNA (guanine966-N2)-methyltransferase